jgi:hypothetical protein
VTIDRRAALHVLLLLAALSIGVPTVEAQERGVHVDVHAAYDYGAELRFEAAIDAPTAVRRAALFYRVLGEAETEVAYATLQSGDQAHALVTIDLHDHPLPPFSTVLYWWHIEFVEGDPYEMVPASLEYIDNRFEWQSLGSDPIEVHWVEGDLTFGQRALNLATTSVTGIENDLGFPPPSQVSIFIYPTIEQLQAGLQIGGRTWVAGRAHPKLSVLLLAHNPNTDAFIQLERDMPHELAHLMLYARMGNAYDNLPGWFNEGIAVLQEENPDAAYRIHLQEAASIDALMPLESLCSGFPFSESDALLAYGESASFVQYLRDIYGVGGFVQLLDAYQEGASCTGGVQRTYRRTLAQLESEWVQSISPSVSPLDPLRPVLPWALLAAAPLVTSLAVWILGRKRPSGRSDGSEP